MILWLTNNVLAVEIWELSLTKPAAGDTTTQISVGKSPYGTLFYMRPGVDVTVSGGFPPIANAKTGWRIGPLTGNMLAWWWEGVVKLMNNEVKGPWRPDLEARISRSPNADGSNATQINYATGWLPPTIPPTITQGWHSNKLTIVPAVAFANEYLFLEFEIQVAHAASDTDADLKFYVNDGIAEFRTPPYEASHMTTSLRSPTTYTGKYFNPGNALTSDNIYALCRTLGFSEIYRNYGFSLAGLALYEVWIEIEHKERTAAVQPFRVSWDNGGNWSPWFEFTNPGVDRIDRVEVTDEVVWDATRLSNGQLVHQVKTVGTGGCLAPEVLLGGHKMLSQSRVNDAILGFDKGRLIHTRITKHKEHNERPFYTLYEIRTCLGTVPLAFYHLVKTLNGWKAAQFIKTGDFVASLFEGKVIYIPVWSNKQVVRRNVIDIKTECGTLFANNMLVHNTHIIK